MLCEKKHDRSKQQVRVKQQGIKDLLKNHQQDECNFPFRWKTFQKNFCKRVTFFIYIKLIYVSL